MADTPYTVDQVSENTTINATGNALKSYVVRFHVGTDGPFTESFAPPDFTPDAVKTKLQKFANDLGQLPRTTA